MTKKNTGIPRVPKKNMKRVVGTGDASMRIIKTEFQESRKQTKFAQMSIFFAHATVQGEHVFRP
jgi:hypothetical protein